MSGVTRPNEVVGKIFTLGRTRSWPGKDWVGGGGEGRLEVGALWAEDSCLQVVMWAALCKGAGRARSACRGHGQVGVGMSGTSSAKVRKRSKSRARWDAIGGTHQGVNVLVSV